MRILITTGIFPPEVGGPATYVPMIASKLCERGHQVCVVAPQEPGDNFNNQDAPYELFRFNHSHVFPYLNFLIEQFNALKIILKHIDRFEIIYINGLNLPATLAGYLKSKPTVVKIVGDSAWEYAFNHKWTKRNFEDFQIEKGLRIRLLRMIFHTAVKRSDSIIVPSQYLAEIVNNWGIDNKKIHVINNFISDQIPNTYKINKIINNIGFRSWLRLVTIGRLIPHKRIDKIIKVLIDGMPKINLTIIGEGPERKNLEALVKKLNLNERVQFTGPIPADAIQLVLREYCDIFILYSTYEGFSHSLIEAAQCGLPIIATSVGGNPEIITNMESGLLIPPEPDSLLFDAVIKLQENHSLRQTLSSNAKKSIKKFSTVHIINKTEIILSDAIQ